MRLFVVVLAVLFISVHALASSDPDSIDIDVSTISPKKADSKVPHNGGDDDEDEGSAIQADAASGSGSGDTTKATPKTKTDHELMFTKKVNTPSPKTEKSTHFSSKGGEITEKPKVTEMSTEKMIEVVKKNEGKATTPTEDDMLGGGVNTESPYTKEPDVQARKQGQDGALSVLTTEVIAAVVVGGVCAIILIAFLVYRLRKRDEGSYVLTDTAYKDTNKLRGDPAKEAFV